MLAGNRALLGLTSTSAAARYQVVTASLQNSADRFVAPTEGGMLAAAEAMTSVDERGRVLGFVADSATARTASEAYPLTLPVYAAANPAAISEPLRAAYAAFITYAASEDGQTPGVDVGRLPDGYASIPPAWAQAAAAAAAAIAAGPTAPPTNAPSTVPGTTGGSANPAPTSTGSGAGAGAAPATVQQPAASGTPSAALTGGTTPDDPAVAAGAALPLSILAGSVGAIASAIVSRRRPIRAWARR